MAERVGFEPSSRWLLTKTLRRGTLLDMPDGSDARYRLLHGGPVQTESLYLLCTCSRPFVGIDGIDTTCFAVNC